MLSNEGIYPPFNEYRLNFLSQGPLCRYAVDLIPMFKAMAGGPEKLESKLPGFDKTVDLKKLKVYYMLQSGVKLSTAVSAEMRESVIAAANHFKDLGCSVQQVNIAAFKHNFDIFAESYKDPGSPSMAEEVTGLQGEVSVAKELFKSMFGRSDYTFPVLVVCVIEKMIGRGITAKTTRFRELGQSLKKEFCSLVKDDAIFLYPPFPIVAPKHKTTLCRLFDGPAYLSIFNILGVPVTQVPLGLSKEGMPLGVQVIAGPHQDRLTLAAALELDRKFGGWVPPCNVTC